MFYAHVNENLSQYKFSNLVKDAIETDEQSSFEKLESETDSLYVNEDWTLNNKQSLNSNLIINNQEPLIKTNI